MAVLLSEIKWGDPLVPAAHDAAWEAELKRRGAQILEVDRRVATSQWLREVAYEATSVVFRSVWNLSGRWRGLPSARCHARSWSR